jgi:hypothetical protein
MQAYIDQVSRANGWVLDRHNVQRQAYSHRFTGRTIPTLGDRDAMVIAGEYGLTHDLFARLAFRVIYPGKLLAMRLAGRLGQPRTAGGVEAPEPSCPDADGSTRPLLVQ